MTIGTAIGTTIANGLNKMRYGQRAGPALPGEWIPMLSIHQQVYDFSRWCSKQQERKQMHRNEQACVSQNVTLFYSGTPDEQQRHRTIPQRRQRWNMEKPTIRQ
jgi:hypothetical protein